MLGASTTPFRPAPARTLSESVVQDKGNNVFAGAVQAGSKRDYLSNKAGVRGFSRSAGDQMRAQQNYAANAAKGGQEVAGIQADAQSFNESQRNAYQQMLEEGLIGAKNNQNEINSITFDRMFNRDAGNQRLMQQRQESAMNLRLALLGQGLL